MRWLFRHLNVQFRCGWVVKVLPLEAKILQNFQLLNCTSNFVIFWNIYRIIGSIKKFEILFLKINTLYQHWKIMFHKILKKSYLYLQASKLKKGQAIKPQYSTIHCISRCYRLLNLRKFFILTQISKNRCQITSLRTINLPKRCSGEWFGT